MTIITVLKNTNNKFHVAQATCWADIHTGENLRKVPNFAFSILWPNADEGHGEQIELNIEHGELAVTKYFNTLAVAEPPEADIPFHTRRYYETRILKLYNKSKSKLA